MNQKKMKKMMVLVMWLAVLEVESQKVVAIQYQADSQ